MQARPPRRRRARPVADAPLDALLLATDDLTKGWLLALLEQAPLDGAQSLEAVSRAVDALLAVLWSALRDELRTPDPDQVSELAERLALIGELVRGAALRRHGAGDDTPPIATKISLGPRGV